MNFTGRTNKLSSWIAGSLVMACGTAIGQVSPATVDLNLANGDSSIIDKVVTIPAIPTNIEICLVADVSYSFDDDLENLKAKQEQ